MFRQDPVDALRAVAAIRPAAPAYPASLWRGRRERARKKARLRELFPKIRVTEVRVSDLAGVRVGDSIEVRLVLDLGQLEPNARTYVGAIKQSGELLLDLITEILDYSRLETGRSPPTM